MSEAGQAAVEPPAAPPAAVATPPAEEIKKPVAPGGAGAAPEAAEPVEQWPQDWRERLAGDDAKELARLKRYATPENYLTRTRGIENQMRSGLLKPVLGDKASEPEVAEYRKAHGIPAEPSLEGYGLKFTEGYQPTDSDKADVGEFLSAMHKSNVPASTVQTVWNAYLGLQEKATQQMHDAAQKQTVENKAAIRAEYGREFARNMQLGNAFLNQHLGEEKAQALTAIPLSDGTLLGDHPDFVRLFVAAALANADDAALVTETGAGAGSLEEQFQAGLKLMDTDAKTYHSPEHQAKMQRLAEAMARKQAA